MWGTVGVWQEGGGLLGLLLAANALRCGRAARGRSPCLGGRRHCVHIVDIVVLVGDGRALRVLASVPALAQQIRCHMPTAAAIFCYCASLWCRTGIT